MAVFVQMPIEWTLNEAMTSRRDDRLNVVGSEVFENGVGVVGFVGADRVRMQILKQRQRLWAVAGFTAGQSKSCHGSQSFHQRVNLGTQSAAGPTERLVPALFGCTGRVLMCANEGAVDKHFLEIRILRQLSKDALPNTGPRPSRKALINAIPKPKFRR